MAMPNDSTLHNIHIRNGAPFALLDISMKKKKNIAYSLVKGTKNL